MGLFLTKDRIKPKEVLSNKIIQFPVLQDAKTIESLLALCNYCSEFIPNFARIAEPLNKFLRKTQPWAWTSERQGACEELNCLMSEPSFSAYPDYSKPLVRYFGASVVEIGAVLLQKQEEKFRITRYLSWTLQ